VLALVGEVFRLIPLKTESVHYIIIITNSTLCNIHQSKARLSRFCSLCAGSFDEHRF
jgi:hypothetical protein